MLVADGVAAADVRRLGRGRENGWESGRASGAMERDDAGYSLVAGSKRRSAEEGVLLWRDCREQKREWWRETAVVGGGRCWGLAAVDRQKEERGEGEEGLGGGDCVGLEVLQGYWKEKEREEEGRRE